MKECPNCKASNNDNAYSCYNCGKSLGETKLTNDNDNPTIRVCAICHTENDINNCKCCHCNASFDEINSHEPKENKPSCECSHCHKPTYEMGLCNSCKSAKTRLKVIMYIVVIILWGLFNALLISTGVKLGALPTILILGFLFALANYIPNAYYN